MIYKKIYQEFIKNAIGVTFKHNFEGQGINNKRYVLGDKAGPSRDPSNLLHEMSHFCELEIERLLKMPNFGWGFTYGKFWQIGVHWGYEQSTDQQVQREARTWAYQLSLQRHYNYEDDPVELVSSAVFLPAWCYYQPFEYKSHDDKEKVTELAKHVDKLSKNFTYERFCEEWDVRNKLIGELI